MSGHLLAAGEETLASIPSFLKEDNERGSEDKIFAWLTPVNYSTRRAFHEAIQSIVDEPNDAAVRVVDRSPAEQPREEYSSGDGGEVDLRPTLL